MLNIQKGSSPRLFRDYIAQPRAIFDGPKFTEAKQALRESLVTEQHGLCAYCMGRIEAKVGAMKVEHWQCQDNFPQRQLDYSNLLGVCTGHEGKPKMEQTCDTRKGNDDLSFNPSDPLHDVFSKIHYQSGDGRISANDAGFDLQIGDEGIAGIRGSKSVLNLNLPMLKLNRRAAHFGTVTLLRADKRMLTKAEVQKIIAKLEGKTEWPEYYGVILFFLQKRLRGA